ncbi:MAG: aldehyde dehydrogenase, partial [Solirubrobacteraceae bacterium]|nr:aldehyde dehydrogenase [Solirubrobacteraceae bacterium]
MATSTPTLIARDELYIGGEWTAPSESATIDVIGAASEEVIGRIPQGTADDVDRAVAAAREAFETWSLVPVEQRAELCAAIAGGLQDRQEEIAALISQELGMPITLSTMIQSAMPVMSVAAQPQLVDEVAWEERIGNSLVLREPVGVVGAITPWNYPLHQVAAKVAPAMTAGCTVVLKPSEVTPLSAFVLAEVMDAVGVPAGVFNLVTGFGQVVGEAMSAHPGIDMISFTGSTAAGRRVSANAAATVKRVSLELGGKSPNVILDDADLEVA